MDLQVMHVNVAKVIGRTMSHGQIYQWKNHALQSYPRIYFRCSFSNAHDSATHRVRIPHALRTKSERKIQLFNSHCDTSHVTDPFRFWGRSLCELSNTRLGMNNNKLWLMSGQQSTYFRRVIRSFCCIPRLGTRNRVIWTEGELGDRKRPCERQELQLTRTSANSKDHVPISDSEHNINGFGDATRSTNTKDFGNFKEVETAEKCQGNEKTKRPAKSKNKNKQSSVASAPALKEKVAVGSGETPRGNKKVKISVTSSSCSVTEVVDNDAITKNQSDKMIKSTATKKKSKTKPQSSHNTEENNAKHSKPASLGQTSMLTNKTKIPVLNATLQLYPPTAKSLLVVESVTKAKVIQGYLGDMFEVVPSHGHVRDLAGRSGSVRPDDDFSMLWEVPHAAWSHLKSMKVALSGVKNLILATDPDREGEAIAWHIVEMLHQQDALPKDVNVARVSFHEITESSIKVALQSPREIDVDLVNAYLARRALDYLIGFNISPLLWRKLPGCVSAGRVQSAALGLICDREKDIDEFVAQEYWTVNASFQGGYPNSTDNMCFSSHLTHFESNKLSRLSISSNLQAKDIEEKVHLSKFVVISSKTSKLHKNPPTPFITSTLQQEAANKLNFSASYTMKVAQKLYEGIQFFDGKATGLITYMRTDGLHLSDEAARDIRSYVLEKYGSSFASKTTRKYFKKVKNAQEAHEAIRPTDIRRLPSSLVGVLDEDSLKLYTLIWSRTMACQMEHAVFKQIQCEVGNEDQSIMFHVASSQMDFLGFRAVYEDSQILKDDDEDDYSGHNHDKLFEILCNLKRGQPLNLIKVELGQHFTKPPPRYSEGSLVKKLEELGIGRPSTYAVTIKVLKDRKYVVMKNRILYPEFRGRMVSAFLSHYFSEVTDYSFTADMETELDNVSAGTTEWKGLLSDYWTRFEKYCASASELQIREVEKMLEKTYSNFLFSSLRDGNRTCPSCSEGTLVFKVSRVGSGYFLGCDQYPKCKYIAKTLLGDDDEDLDDQPQKTAVTVQPPKLLGLHPGSNEKILLKNGPYGPYLQLGEDRKGHTPKRASLSQVKDVNSFTLEQAVDLLKYPITLGNHPKDDRPVILRLGKVGFAIKHRRSIASVPKNMKPENVTLEEALKLLQGKDVRKTGRPKRSAQVSETLEVF